MFLSRFLVGAVLIGTALADLNYTAVLELPTCAVSFTVSNFEGLLMNTGELFRVYRCSLRLQSQ
jgi:hypothetical protein